LIFSILHIYLLVLVLEWCERKTLLAGWWLEAAAGVV